MFVIIILPLTFSGADKVRCHTASKFMKMRQLKSSSKVQKPVVVWWVNWLIYLRL